MPPEAGGQGPCFRFVVPGTREQNNGASVLPAQELSMPLRGSVFTA